MTVIPEITLLRDTDAFQVNSRVPNHPDCRHVPVIAA